MERFHFFKFKIYCSSLYTKQLPDINLFKDILGFNKPSGKPGKSKVVPSDEESEHQSKSQSLPRDRNNSFDPTAAPTSSRVNKTPNRSDFADVNPSSQHSAAESGSSSKKAADKVAKPVYQYQEPANADGRGERRALAGGWEEVTTEDGQRYYYHTVTRVSR